MMDLIKTVNIYLSKKQEKAEAEPHPFLLTRICGYLTRILSTFGSALISFELPIGTWICVLSGLWSRREMAWGCRRQWNPLQMDRLISTLLPLSGTRYDPSLATKLSTSDALSLLIFGKVTVAGCQGVASCL